MEGKRELDLQACAQRGVKSFKKSHKKDINNKALINQKLIANFLNSAYLALCFFMPPPLILFWRKATYTIYTFIQQKICLNKGLSKHPRPL